MDTYKLALSIDKLRRNRKLFYHLLENALEIYNLARLPSAGMKINSA